MARVTVGRARLRRRGRAHQSLDGGEAARAATAAAAAAAAAVAEGIYSGGGGRRVAVAAAAVAAAAASTGAGTAADAGAALAGYWLRPNHGSRKNHQKKPMSGFLTCKRTPSASTKSCGQTASKGGGIGGVQALVVGAFAERSADVYTLVDGLAEAAIPRTSSQNRPTSKAKGAAKALLYAAFGAAAWNAQSALLQPRPSFAGAPSTGSLAMQGRG
jgi:hypothetical protein